MHADELASARIIMFAAIQKPVIILVRSRLHQLPRSHFQTFALNSMTPSPLIIIVYIETWEEQHQITYCDSDRGDRIRLHQEDSHRKLITHTLHFYYKRWLHHYLIIYRGLKCPKCQCRIGPKIPRTRTYRSSLHKLFDLMDSGQNLYEYGPIRLKDIEEDSYESFYTDSESSDIDSDQIDRSKCIYFRSRWYQQWAHTACILRGNSQNYEN